MADTLADHTAGASITPLMAALTYTGARITPPVAALTCQTVPTYHPRRWRSCAKAIGLGMIVLVSSILMIVWVAARQRGSGGAGGAGSRTR